MDVISPSVLTSEEVKNIRLRLGLRTGELAQLCGVNIKTVERWENGESKVHGAAAAYISMLYRFPSLMERITVPDMPFDLRLFCYKKGLNPELVCIIDVNEADRFVELINYTDRVEDLPFEKVTRPSWEEYNQFIKSVCSRYRKNRFADPIEELMKTGGEGEFTIVVQTAE